MAVSGARRRRKRDPSPHHSDGSDRSTFAAGCGGADTQESVDPRPTSTTWLTGGQGIRGRLVAAIAFAVFWSSFVALIWIRGCLLRSLPIFEVVFGWGDAVEEQCRWDGWSTVMVLLVAAALRVWWSLPRRVTFGGSGCGCGSCGVGYVGRQSGVLLSPSGARALIVLGSGGHTAEMISIVKGLPPRMACTFLRAETDTTSEPSASRQPHIRSRKGTKFATLPRSREVGQSFLSSISTTVVAMLSCVPLLLKYQPDVILVNGPGTCLPVVAIGVALRTAVPRMMWYCIAKVANAFGAGLIARRGGFRVVYVESVCRLRGLSMTGKLLYLLTDRFFVQWRELHDKLALTEYAGLLI